MATTSASCLPSVTTAVIARLNADSTLTTALGGQKVYTYVPDDEPPPYVWFVTGAERANNTLGTPGRQAQIRCTVVSRYRGTAEVDDLASRISELLDGVDLALTGSFSSARVDFDENEEPVFSLDGGDGQRYTERTARFMVRAL